MLCSHIRPNHSTYSLTFGNSLPGLLSPILAQGSFSRMTWHGGGGTQCLAFPYQRPHCCRSICIWTSLAPNACLGCSDGLILWSAAGGPDPCLLHTRHPAPPWPQWHVPCHLLGIWSQPFLTWPLSLALIVQTPLCLVAMTMCRAENTGSVYGPSCLFSDVPPFTTHWLALVSKGLICVSRLLN